MAATLKEIAAKTKLSYQAVSAVLNGNLSKASPASRERIFAIAKELGYKPNAAAKALVSGKTRLIGFLAQDTRFPYHSDLAYELQQEAQRRGYQSILMESNWDDAKTIECLQALLARQVDGFLLMGIPETPEAIGLVKGSSTPAVLVDSRSEALPSLAFDYGRAMDSAMKRFAEAGVRSVGIAHDPVNKAKIGAFLASAAKFHLDVVEFHYRYPMIGGDAQILACGAAIAKSPERPEALLVASDYEAALILRAFSEAGLTAPRDIAVLTFDDTFVCRLTSPELAAIRLDRKALAAKALDLLEDLMANPGRKPGRALVDCELVWRRSAEIAKLKGSAR